MLSKNFKRAILLFFFVLMAAPMLAILGMVFFQASTAKQLPANAQQQKRAKAEQLSQPMMTAVNPKPLTKKEIQQARRALPKKDLLLEQARWLNSTPFGPCMFVPVNEQVNGRHKLVFFLVRGDGRLAFEIPQSVSIPQSWSFDSILDLKFTELNFDGGDGDFIVVSNYVDRSQSDRALVPAVTIYQTSGKGYFLDEQINRTLTERKIQTADAAEKILREEFGFLP